MKFAWIDEQAGKDLWWFSISLACEVLEVSTSEFYDWRVRREAHPTAREREQAPLLAEIRTIHEASYGAYGSPRMWAELRDKGWVVGENNRVARLMFHSSKRRQDHVPQ